MRKREGKWLAFESLNTYKAARAEVELNHFKLDQPYLAEDELAILNDCLIDSYTNNFVCEITYYDKGFYKCEKGLIKKIDDINKTIFINNRNIYFNLIKSIKKKENVND